MRRRIQTLLLTGALSLASPVSAGLLDWDGTLVLTVSDIPAFAWTGGGVATVNGSAGGGASLSTLRLAGGITAPGTGPGPTPVTVFVDNSLSFPLRAANHLGVLNGALGTGTLFGIGGTANPTGHLPVRGTIGRYWIPPFRLSLNGTRGLGVGGSHADFSITVVDNIPFPNVVSVEWAPWTLGTAMVAFTTQYALSPILATTQGFLHGPASNTSTAALPGGTLQLVTPMSIRWSSGDGEFGAGTIGQLGKLTVRFVPEPGLLLLLGSGVVGLVAMGRARSSRW